MNNQNFINDGDTRPVKSDDLNLVDRFFDDVRAVGLGDLAEISLSEEELYAIVHELTYSLEFEQKFETFSQDNELKKLIVEIFRSLSRAEKRETQRCDENIKTIDLYGGRLSSGAIVGGVGALLYGAVAAGTVALTGPLVLVGCGVAGIVTCVYSRSKAGEASREANERHEVYTDVVKRLEAKLVEGGAPE